MQQIRLPLLCVLIWVILLGGCTDTPALVVGAPVPDFTLDTARGSLYHLADFSGHTLLLSFLNIQATAGSATADPSCSQIVFLKSMSEQYSSNGLAVLIVDASRLDTGSPPSQDALLNFTYDWQLGSIPVLVDSNGAVAKNYGVTSTPVTFLIGADGKIQQRWDGFASASQLALSIEPLVGAPASRATAPATSVLAPAACANEVAPQAKFAGVGLARSFSEQLWVMDGGTSWGMGAAFPLQFILLDTQNITQQEPVRIQVFVQTANSGQENLVLDQPMELLPADVASGLLSSADNTPIMYSLVTTIRLDQPGCLEVRAVVTQPGKTTPLYQGNFVVPAQ